MAALEARGASAIAWLRSCLIRSPVGGCRGGGKRREARVGGRAAAGSGRLWTGAGGCRRAGARAHGQEGGQESSFERVLDGQCACPGGWGGDASTSGPNPTAAESREQSRAAPTCVDLHGALLLAHPVRGAGVLAVVLEQLQHLSQPHLLQQGRWQGAMRMRFGCAHPRGQPCLLQQGRWQRGGEQGGRGSVVHPRASLSTSGQPCLLQQGM